MKYEYVELKEMKLIDYLLDRIEERYEYYLSTYNDPNEGEEVLDSKYEEIIKEVVEEVGIDFKNDRDYDMFMEYLMKK